ncbi:MAG: DJ-1/PfpI family protein [Actinobacteria bacterium]|nr:DJ-1/PfpI family protein [Actinomycetota bacterium]
MATIGILLFNEAEELDVVGPWEVFTASAMLLDEAGDAGDEVVTIARDAGPVGCAKGLRVLPDHTIDDHPRLDVIVVPGGRGTRALVDDTDLLAWLAAVGVDARWITSVCTGSLLLWASGLAKHRRVATHHSFEDEFARLGDVRIVRDARWVRHGNVVTSQGVSAGIDMALWLVGQLHDPAHARATQRYLQYDPAPPYAADV